ncbi:MAG: NADH-quinone oxidoreductase subunit K [Anaerolineales bacterium]|nr:NADH-quinone oxidoreductase subunit K [Anaerolineales bacterium]
MNAPYNIAVLGVFGLLGVGLYGLLASRNLIKIIVALQILVKAALLGLIAAGSVSQQVNLGQSLAVTVIVADTVVAVIGMALAVQIRRQLGTLDVRDLSSLRG